MLLQAATVLTLVILPPLKLAKRLSESVSTLEALWMVKRLLAGTFFLHLEGRREVELRRARFLHTPLRPICGNWGHIWD